MNKRDFILHGSYFVRSIKIGMTAFLGHVATVT